VVVNHYSILLGSSTENAMLYALCSGINDSGNGNEVCSSHSQPPFTQKKISSAITQECAIGGYSCINGSETVGINYK